MNKEYYALETHNDRMEFEFCSEGPKGKIAKGIKYQFMYGNEVPFYNLAFGDLNGQTGEINDLSISDNADKELILATVAASVIMFTDNFPGAAIHAEGSTPSRTRLYQIAIASNYDDIVNLLSVFGYKNGSWHVFEKNVNYEAFVVMRK